MDTLTNPFFNLLIGSSSSGFTKLILTGENLESGIKGRKIPMISPSASKAIKKPFTGKKETNVVYGQRSRIKNDRHQSVGAILISKPTPIQRPQQWNNQQRPDVPIRKFTRGIMPLSQALQHLLKAGLVTLRNSPQNLNTSSPKYNLNAKCAYHSNSSRHGTNDCWALNSKI